MRRSSKKALECDYCHRIIYKYPSEMVCEHNFCDKTCAGLYRTENYFGPNNWLYTGNHERHYCHLFNGRFKRNVREYFEHECFVCGTPQAEQFRALSVHHVMNNPDPGCLEPLWLNVPLCDKCHGLTRRKNEREKWEQILYTKLKEEYGLQCYNENLRRMLRDENERRLGITTPRVPTAPPSMRLRKNRKPRLRYSNGRFEILDDRGNRK